MGDIRVAAVGGWGLVCSDIIVCKLFGLFKVKKLKEIELKEISDEIRDIYTIPDI